jgi:hypothetical protein
MKKRKLDRTDLQFPLSSHRNPEKKKKSKQKKKKKKNKNLRVSFDKEKSAKAVPIDSSLPQPSLAMHYIYFLKKKKIEFAD